MKARWEEVEKRRDGGDWDEVEKVEKVIDGFRWLCELGCARVAEAVMRGYVE